MMLNLQFAETMELTEAELQEISGGNVVDIVENPRRRKLGRSRNILVNH